MTDPAMPAGEATGRVFPPPSPDVRALLSAEELLSPEARARMEATRNALILQLGRAATQGLISVDPLGGAGATEAEGPESELSGAESIVPQEMPAPPEPFFPPRQFRVETAADRAMSPGRVLENLTPEGGTCLNPEFFDVASWGPEEDGGPLLGSLRADLVSEFDEPRAEAVAALSRRYVFWGFGAEARQVLSAFDTDFPGREALEDLAMIVDGRPVDGSGVTATQAGCATEGALWAVLALDRLPAGGMVNTRAVLRTFAGLPSGLRQLLGPDLAARFLEGGDLDAATAIRAIIARAAGAPGEDVLLLDAALDKADGDLEGALDALEAVAREGGKNAPEAIAGLIEQRLEAGAPVPEKTALLADALAVEHRGSALGSRLMHAAIRGLAASGRVEETFERIATALANGDLAPEEAEALRAEAYMAIVGVESDVRFARLWLKSGPAAEELSGKARVARRRAAERFLSIGLPRLALAQYERHEELRMQFAPEERLVLARANLALGRAEEALTHLAGLEGPAARELVAKALELSGDYLKAAREYAELGMLAEADHAKWRAGRWATLESSGIEAFRNAARLSATGADREASDGDARGGAGAAEELSIAEIRKLLEISSQTRESIDALLSQMPSGPGNG